MSSPNVVACTLIALLVSAASARAAQDAAGENGAFSPFPGPAAKDEGFGGDRPDPSGVGKGSLARNEWGPASLGVLDLEPTEKRPDRHQQEEPLDGLPQEMELSREKQGSPFVDLRWMDLEIRAGLAVFSEDYKIDPSPAVSFLLRAPLTCLSPDSDPDGEYFGVYADLAFLPRLDRDLDPEPADPTGTGLLISMGMDFTFVRNQSLLLLVRGGGQYGTYGGITGMLEGFAPVVGLETGLDLGPGMSLTLSSDIVFAGAGDTILLTYLGLLIEF